MDYVLKLPLSRALDLIEKAEEEKFRDHTLKIYLAAYPNFTKKNFITFDEFWEQVKPRKVTYDMRSKEDLIKEAKEIEERCKASG